MKINNFLCIIFFIPILTHAQATLTGKISDENKQPILANIYLPQIEKGTISDLNGTYTISNIPKGTYSIVVSALGFETVSYKVSFDEDNVITKDITLKESAIEMEEVIISTPFHKLQSENVMKVERINTSELTKKGAVNLSQGISNIAGVSSISTGNGIGKPVIRGLSSNRVLTYTQGVRLENQQFGSEHGLGINGSGIESVEVIKGPASLLYGSDAMGGVLYLNPEGFASENNTEVSGKGTYFSNTQGFNSTVGVKTSRKKLKFLVRGSRSSFSDYETGADYRVTNTRYNDYDLKTGIRFQNKKLKSTLRYNYNRSNIGIPEEIGAQNTSKELILPFQEIDNHILSLDNTLFLNNSSVDFKAGYLFNDRREFEETPDEAALRLKLKTFTYDVKYNLPEWGKFTTIAGIQGMFQNNGNFGEEVLIPDAKKIDFGVFTTTHLHFEDWDFQGGVRFDTRKIETEAARNPQDEDYIPAINKDFNSFNMALGGKYNVSENFTGRLNLASGFRAPNLAELASNGVHEGTNRYEIGNPNLKNEQSFQTDLAFEYRSEHFEAFANGFYNSINNYIFISPTGEIIEENPVFDYVQFGANLWGSELGFHLHPHPLDWLHWESSFETVTGELKDGGNLPLIPANTLSNTIRLELNDGSFFKSPYGFITFENTFSQNNPSKFETSTKGYNLLSIGFGSLIKWNKIEINWGINATNITNESYINHLSRLKVDEILNSGRSINFNLGFNL